MNSETTSHFDPKSLLDEHGHLRSDLWLDQPDAHDRIDARTAAGTLDAADAALLHRFVDDGYFTFHINLDAAATDAFDERIGELWQERPADLPISVPGPGGPQSFAIYEGDERPLGYRLPDLHGFSQNAMDLYLHPDIFRLIDLIFDQPAVAFQSLYFEYGSTQALHRDPMFVQTRPVAHLAAAWIALEDITADSGPLLYIPGSHRLPWFEFEENSIELKPQVSQEKRAEYKQWNWDTVHSGGKLPRPYTCRRGDVFIWHGALQHGGDKITNPEKTRKSFVVHYSTSEHYRARTAYLQVRDDVGLRTVKNTTTALVETENARGFDSPMKGR